MDKLHLLRIASTIEEATIYIAKEYTLTRSSVRVLAACYSIEQAGKTARASVLQSLGYGTYATLAQRTEELRTAGYLVYKPKSRRGLLVTTAGKLLCNAFAREIEREAQRLQKI